MGREKDKKRSRIQGRHELVELRKEVAQAYARAMEGAQELEGALIMIALAMGTASSVEALEADAMDLAKKPLERLRKAVGQRFGGDLGQLERDLDRARRIRNFLAHNYFRERESTSITKEGCLQMQEELDRCAMFLHHVEERLMDKFKEQIMTFGGRELPQEAEEQLEALLTPGADGFGRAIPGLPEPGTVPGML